MRLGDFRKATEGLSDDYILDSVMFAEVLDGAYDGRPIDYVNHTAVYTCENKIKLHMFECESWFWEICEADKTYEENLTEFLKVFRKSDTIEDSRWDEFIKNRKKIFDDLWNNTEWSEFLLSGGAI